MMGYVDVQKVGSCPDRVTLAASVKMAMSGASGGRETESAVMIAAAVAIDEVAIAATAAETGSLGIQAAASDVTTAYGPETSADHQESCRAAAVIADVAAIASPDFLSPQRYGLAKAEPRAVASSNRPNTWNEWSAAE